MSGKVTLEVRIEPVDPILFGDNRSARTGEGHAVSDQDPSPATLYGAIGGRIADRLGARGERHWEPAKGVLGPFTPGLARVAGEPDRAELLGYALCNPEGRPWFPKPLHLRVRRAKRGNTFFALDLLRPQEAGAAGQDGVLSSLPSGWRPLAGLPEIREQDEHEGPLLVDEDLLGDVLAGEIEPETGLGSSTAAEDDLQLPERRLGLALLNAANTARPGRLFARPYRRFLRRYLGSRETWASCGFLAWYGVLGLPAEGASTFDGLGFLGGDRRRADLRFQPARSSPLSEVLRRVREAARTSAGFLAYLLTPVPVPAAGLSFRGLRPVAAALGRPQRVSGWASAAATQGPRPLLTLLPAGSVLFFDWPEEQSDPAARERWIEESWLGALDTDHAVTGFGRILPGVWR